MRADRILLDSTTIGTGIMAGFFFAYSVSVVPGLLDMPAAGAVAAMQAINRAVRNVVFGVAFFGTAVLCALMLLRGLSGALDRLVLPGAAAYLGGVLAVTLLANVPLNEALATLDPAATATAESGAQYFASWAAWNHLRTAAATLAFVLFLAARAPISRSGA